MSITSVTEVEAPQHYQSCTDMAVGRYVRWLIEANSPDVEIPLHLLIAGSEQHRPFCQCFHKQLAGVEEGSAGAPPAPMSIDWGQFKAGDRVLITVPVTVTTIGERGEHVWVASEFGHEFCIKNAVHAEVDVPEIVPGKRAKGGVAE